MVRYRLPTAIPRGIYELTLDIVSPKFSKYDFYKEVCNGKLPRLKNVKGFEGILIHVADGYRVSELLDTPIDVNVETNANKVTLTVTLSSA